MFSLEPTSAQVAPIAFIADSYRHSNAAESGVFAAIPRWHAVCLSMTSPASFWENIMQTGRTSDSTKKPAAKTRARSATTAKKETLHLKSQQLTEMPSTDELTGMIATAAYFCAEQRSFAPGHELEDWLTAEQQIKALYG
jgi:hypothetical protein